MQSQRHNQEKHLPVVVEADASAMRAQCAMHSLNSLRLLTHQPKPRSYKLQVTRYKLQATSYELQATPPTNLVTKLTLPACPSIRSRAHEFLRPALPPCLSSPPHDNSLA